MTEIDRELHIDPRAPRGRRRGGGLVGVLHAALDLATGIVTKPENFVRALLLVWSLVLIGALLLRDVQMLSVAVAAMVVLSTWAAARLMRARVRPRDRDDHR